MEIQHDLSYLLFFYKYKKYIGVNCINWIIVWLNELIEKNHSIDSIVLSQVQLHLNKHFSRKSSFNNINNFSISLNCYFIDHTRDINQFLTIQKCKRIIYKFYHNARIAKTFKNIKLYTLRYHVVAVWTTKSNIDQ